MKFWRLRLKLKVILRTKLISLWRQDSLSLRFPKQLAFNYYLKLVKLKNSRIKKFCLDKNWERLSFIKHQIQVMFPGKIQLLVGKRFGAVFGVELQFKQSLSYFLSSFSFTYQTQSYGPNLLFPQLTALIFSNRPIYCFVHNKIAKICKKTIIIGLRVAYSAIVKRTQPTNKPVVFTLKLWNQRQDSTFLSQSSWSPTTYSSSTFAMQFVTGSALSV